MAQHPPFTFEDLKNVLVNLVGIPASAVPDDLNASFEAIGLDSIHFIEIEVEMEQRYGIRIPAEDAGQIHTIGEAIDYVNRRLGE
jgi:acyl carrier protein